MPSSPEASPKGSEDGDEYVPRSPSPKRPRRSESPEKRREKSRSPERRRERSRSPERRRRRRSSSHERDSSRRRRSSSRDHDSRRRRRSRTPPRRRRSPSPEAAPAPKKEEKPKEEVKDLLRTRTGGAYIPPAKLRLMQEQIQDKAGEQYQRMNWERLKKKIHGLVNRVNVGNLVQIVRELLQENVIRGKGLLCRSIIQAQAFSPGFSHVYAALVAVINSKFPHVGELLLRRLIVQFKRSFRRNDKGVTVPIVKFIGHLINQQVAHEVLALEIIILMLEEPTDDSVEVAIAFLKECGAKLLEVAPAALNSVFDRLRVILMESNAEDPEMKIDVRIRYMIEVAMQIRKEGFKAYPAVLEDLDLIDEEDQITHTLNLEEATDPENGLNVFKLDPDFEKNEEAYDEIRKEIIGDADVSSDEEDDDEDEESDEENQEKEPKKTTTEIIDNTDQNLIAFRREVYLTLQSSLDFQEAAHKLLKMGIKPEMENELCNMLVDCCAQQRTYERFYGMLIERFCRLRLEYQQMFEQIARDSYATVHRFDITKLRNLARLVAHLLVTDAIDWKIWSDVKLTEADTTSSGRIYIKYVFQELVEAMGLVKLYERMKDPTLANYFSGLFPRDNPANARFAINYFTAIGLGGLTLDHRAWLDKGLKKQKDLFESLNDSSSSDSSSSDSDSSDSDSDSESDSSSDSSDSVESTPPKKSKKNKKVEEKKKRKSREKSPEKRHHHHHHHKKSEESRDDREHKSRDRSRDKKSSSHHKSRRAEDDSPRENRRRRSRSVENRRDDEKRRRH
ncbi:unnamed protein product [Caenorhabditis angaria]|uniref:Lethal protein 858 n=1 Tax=Caenorhabditis angaria TaxID=860376 RepID=A0A9P1IEZ1_9PELO|nr:unnamed protein product [Caenorhabditis angaria]